MSSKTEWLLFVFTLILVTGAVIAGKAFDAWILKLFFK